MKEYGGYLEAERYRGAAYHQGLLRVNTARNAILLAVQHRGYKKLHMPLYLCDSVPDRLAGHAGAAFYHINEALEPVGVGQLPPGEALLLVNYFGMYDSRTMEDMGRRYGSVIVDNTQAFFARPVQGMDTVYSCRKYFGVTDGAYLAADGLSLDGLEQGRSAEHLDYLFGRFEDTAQAHFAQFHQNEERLDREGPQRMSAITENLLSGIDYAGVQAARHRNYQLFRERLDGVNELDAGRFSGDFMYPLLHRAGAALKKHLIAERIYTPTLWPNVLTLTDAPWERRLAEELVLLPIDQRYGPEDISAMAGAVETFLRGKEV